MNTVNLYREEILEHYQSPHNFGEIKNADRHSRQTNPLCGDDIKMWIKFDSSALRQAQGSAQKNVDNGKVVKDVRFFGRGCAICMAGASMLTEYALGKSKAQLTKFSENDMLKMLGIKVSETRRKCALLSLAVLKDCFG
ncbi:iron-sulfur cluster assembly scaffold protein [Candidatus Microgenomates bacterium]|nr:iron-sulfur cluster assembly scaffold protein [Candidatus Microgenomates bacterium]